MSKKGTALKTLVSLILIGIFAFIIIFSLFPQIQTVLLGAGEEAPCQFSIILSKISRLGTLGLADIPKECKAKRIIVDKDMLDDFIKKNKIESVLKDYADSASENYNKVLAYYYNPDDLYSKYRWAFAKIVAESLNDCRKKVLADTGLAERSSFTGFEETECIVCYRIRVDSSVLPLLKEKNFMFSNWLKANNPKLSESSYYELLTSQASDYEKSIFNQHLDLAEIIEDPKDAVAVMYVHVPLPGSDDDIFYISLFPYKDITHITVAAYEVAGEETDTKCGIILD